MPDTAQPTPESEALTFIGQMIARLSFSGPDGTMGAIEAHGVHANEQMEKSSDRIGDAISGAGAEINMGLESVAAAISDLADAIRELKP